MIREEIIDKLYHLKEKLVTFVTRTESLLNRVIMFGLLLAFILWISFGAIVNLLVSENRVKTNIITKLDQISGNKADIQGDVKFYKEPEPVFVINKLVVGNETSLNKQNFLEAEIARTSPSIANAVLGHVNLDNAFFENVKLNIDIGEGTDGITILKKIFSKGGLSDKKLSFKNLTININKKDPITTDKVITRTFTFPTLEGTIDPGSSSSVNIKGSINSKTLDQTYFFELSTKGRGADQTYSGRIYANDTEMKFSGKLNAENDVSFDGNMEGTFNGFTKALFSLVGVPQEFKDSIRSNEQAKISASYSYANNHLSLKNLTANSQIIAASASDEIDMGAKNNSVIELDIGQLNYDQMFKSHFEMVSERKAQKIERNFRKKLEDFFLFALGDDVNFTFRLKAPKINFYNNQVGTLDVSASLKDDNFVISSFKAQLPGESAMSVTSNINVLKQQQQLKGSVRIVIAGKDMDTLSASLDNNGADKKQQRFGQFYIDTKGFLYNQNIHFREIIARINDDKFAGQMLIDYSKDFNASAAFDFTNLSIDKYIQLDKNPDLGLSKGENILAEKLDFLRVIDSLFDRLDLSLEADKMTKNSQTYTDFSIYAQVMPGVTEVKNIFFKSDILGQVSGKAHLDLTDFQPKLQVNLELDKYDMDLLMYGEQVKQNDVYNFDGRWSNEKVNFDKLGSFQGNLDLKIDTLKFFHYTLTDFTMKSHTDEGKFIIDAAKGNIFGNKIDFRGYLTSEYPSFNISFITTDLDMKSFMAQTLGFGGIDATFNMSGVIAGTGYTIEQMVQSLKGNFSIASKGFTLDGFDLTATGKALPLVKRREYIKIISDELLSKGQTQFGFFTGVFQIDQGHIIFDNLKLTSDQIQSGTVSGNIDLPDWSANIKSNFDALTANNDVYNLQGTTTGNIPDVETEWDDKGMMSYWEGKFFNGR